MPPAARTRLDRPARRSLRRLIPRPIGAAWHHFWALLKEFRAPLIIFLFLTLVGGLAYGELYEAIRGVTIPLLDRPYIIVQLMILEAPEGVPPEGPLVAFWYIMPLGFVLLVGLGAADFVNLVLNRDENRNPWAEALALTYRNHVIVFGAGHVGQRVIASLVSMGLDVVAIDQSPSAVAEKRLGQLAVPIIRGDGTLSDTLEKARLSHAEAFVACTGTDQANMESIMKVRHGYPTIRIVGRMWDRRFAEQLEEFMNVQSVLSSADLAAPAFAGAAIGVEVTQTLQIEGLEYSTMRLTVGERSALAGRTVGALQKELEVDIVLVDSDGSARVRPPRKHEVAVGDDVVFFARHDRVLDVMSLNMGKKSSVPRKARGERRAGVERRVVAEVRPPTNQGSDAEHRSGLDRRSPSEPVS